MLHAHVAAVIALWLTADELGCPKATCRVPPVARTALQHLTHVIMRQPPPARSWREHGQ
jgi:hypothetical protein